MNWDGVKKASEHTMDSIRCCRRSFNAFLPDDEGNPGKQVSLNIDETVHQNAQRYFQAGRKQKDKSAGAIQALEDTKLELERAKKQAKKEASGQVAKVRASDYGLKTTNGQCYQLTPHGWKHQG